MSESILANLVKTEPAPTFVGNNISLVNAVPHKFSYKRRVIIDALKDVLNQAPVIAPPTNTGVIAGVPPTLVQTFAVEAKIAGIFVSLDAGDQTPIGQATITLAYTDPYGVARTQVYTVKIKNKSTDFVILIATNDADIVAPLALVVTVAAPLVVTVNGPTGFGVSTELINCKHPELLSLLNSDLYERLIRWQLNQEQS